MATELYVSLVSHKATLLKRDKYKESEIREELNERLDVFGKVFDQLVSSLRDYEPAVLGEYEDENGAVFFSPVIFLQLPAHRTMAESPCSVHAA